MSSHQGADELRIRGILRQRGVGPDAPPATAPPRPAGRPRDWLDNILDNNATPPPAPAGPPPTEEPEPEAEPAQEPAPKTKARKKKRKKRGPRPGTPRSAWDTQPRSPRQSLLDAWDGVPYRLKWLAYHASAAYLGWSTGLVDWVTYVTAWISDNSPYGPQSIFWYCVAAAAFLLHHRTRTWWKPVAWLAAVPACSVVVGVLLYGNGWTELELSL